MHPKSIMLITRSCRGFSLIEIMIAVAIIAILAGIALPSYQEYVRTSRRVDGQNSLQQLMLAQEKYRSNNTSYASSLTELPGIQASSADGHYTIAITSANGSGYAATATATGDQAKDSACATMTLTLTNGVNLAKTPAACWKK